MPTEFDAVLGGTQPHNLLVLGGVDSIVQRLKAFDTGKPSSDTLHDIFVDSQKYPAGRDVMREWLPRLVKKTQFEERDILFDVPADAGDKIAIKAECLKNVAVNETISIKWVGKGRSRVPKPKVVRNKWTITLIDSGLGIFLGKDYKNNRQIAKEMAFVIQHSRLDLSFSVGDFQDFRLGKHIEAIQKARDCVQSLVDLYNNGDWPTTKV